MLNRASRERETSCFSVIFRDERFRQTRYPRIRTPAKSILAAVRKRGGECSRAIFPREKTLDQIAKVEINKNIDIVLGRIAR